MIKEYSKPNFLKLQSQRQAEVLYQLLRPLELDLRGESNLQENLARFNVCARAHEYIQWIVQDSQDSLFKERLYRFREGFSTNPTPELLSSFVVLLERHLGHLGPKDEDLILVNEGDHLEKSVESLPMVVVLEHLRSAFNVGAVLRSAEAMGVERVMLTGYTPGPKHPAVKKTAMGTDLHLKCDRVEDSVTLINTLKDQGYRLLGLETATEAVSLSEFKAPERVAVFLGNERFGLSQRTLAAMDDLVSIPLRGRKNSLNVATAFGIFAFEVSRQWT